jgi:transcriptional regulator with XRE-family HTH domain
VTTEERATGSTVPRRQLGRYLRELRESARMSVRLAAEQLEWSTPRIWRVETGQVAMRSLDVRNMCELYGAPADTTDALMGLAKETKAKGWWHAYGDVIPEGFNLYVGLEEAATGLTWYESELIPGLLQTDSYAQEIIHTHYPHLSEDGVDGRVRLRIERQSILTRVTAPLELRVALSETVLRRPVGGPKVMAHQLAHLVYMSELPNLSLRVVPFAAGTHIGILSGAFEILRFPLKADGSETEPPVVYVDGYTGGLYLDKPQEIEQYEGAFRGIWEAALDEQASRRLIADVAGNYEQD